MTFRQPFGRRFPGPRRPERAPGREAGRPDRTERPRDRSRRRNSSRPKCSIRPSTSSANRGEATTGTRKIDPIETRSTLRENGSGHSEPVRMPSMPKTSPIRAIAPRFSGSLSLGQITRKSDSLAERTISSIEGKGPAPRTPARRGETESPPVDRSAREAGRRWELPRQS